MTEQIKLIMARIQSKLEAILPNGIVIYELSYGRKYTIILASEDRKARHGVTFDSAPTNRQIHQAVAECVKVIMAKKKRDAQSQKRNIA